MSIRVDELTYLYKQPGEVRPALDNVSFSIEDGEIIGIIGHTGSGKSTLLQHLNGLLKATSGTVFIDGVNIYEGKEQAKLARSKVGLVFQYPEYQLFEETVHADVAFGPKNLSMNEDEINMAVKEAISLVGLNYDSVKDRSPFELSGGQKRRVAIAGVIAMKPKILILDEPTAGLDPEAHEEIIDMVLDIHRKQGCTIIFVSHNMDDVARISDRVMVMNGGKLALMDTPDNVFKETTMLRSLGLDVPQGTGLLCKLKDKGLSIEPSLVDEEQCVEKIMDCIDRKKLKDD